MRTYTLEMLSRPDIYTLDSELATLARKAAVEAYQAIEPGIISLGDWKRQFLSGEHADEVFDYQNRVHGAQQAAAAEYERLVALIDALALPAGVTVTVDGGSLKIKAPFDGGDLNKRLNKKGGHWDSYEKCIVVPLAAVESLPKIFANWAKAQGITQQAKADAEAQRVAAQEKARREREAAWQAERQREYEQRKAAEAAESARRAKAVARRVKVIAGQYKTGDMLEGRQITGFGKSWTETDAGSWGRRGTRYDEACACCHRVTVIDNWTELCERCGADGESVMVQYAYFE